VSAMEAMKHPGSLTLRRLLAGEAVGGEITEHAAGCDVCQATLRAFTAEQQAFEAELPFERFAAGVERAARQPRAVSAQRRWVPTVLALAAGVTLIVGVQRLLSTLEPAQGINRLKGGATVELIVAGREGQRAASQDPAVSERLAAGERVRVGLTRDSWKYALVVSIDDAGEITPIYLENGRSIPLEGAGTTWLPDSLEFTGAGLERLVVVLTASPLTLDQVAAPLKLAYDDARGDLTRLATLPLPGAQVHRTFHKP
jgi:hypothetical protein